MMFPELPAKRLNLLTQAVLGISRVLVLAYLKDPIAHLKVQALQNAARSLGVTLQIQDIRTSDDLPAAFDFGIKGRAEGLLTTAESIFSVHGARVTELAARHRLPAIYPILQQAIDRGGLMAYAPNSADLYRRAASYAATIPDAYVFVSKRGGPNQIGFHRLIQRLGGGRQDAIPDPPTHASRH